MTANAYVPNRKGRLPAILAVHGHWRGAKQDPVVQARCIGAAKLGFFVLAVDALGAGERAVGKTLGEYHGEMTAATLFPTGLPLSGAQVYENMRAVDYLRSRPEVDPERIGITGASGGGNQTMYAGAWDRRFAAAVPVCSVGNYQAYLGAACCLCEVVPGALAFTEERGVLSLFAPRSLMVINATRDARQFSVEEAKKSLPFAEKAFAAHSHVERLQHRIFESQHDYNRPMREAMYGWMTRWLKGEGDGSPIAEPEIQTEDPELLRCFPKETRPDDWVTLPKFAAMQARAVLQEKRAPASAAEWSQMRAKLKKRLVLETFGGFPAPTPLKAQADRASNGLVTMTFEPEPGLRLTAHLETAANAPLAVILDLEGEQSARAQHLAAALKRAGRSVVTLDLRATGKLGWRNDSIGAAPDHTTAEWSLWLGRPLLGQWVWDVRRLLDALEQTVAPLPKDVAVIGVGAAGLVALCAGALDNRITRVAAIGTLASYVTETPYVGQRLGVMAPHILRDVGDVAHLAALIAPRRLAVCGGVLGDGRVLDEKALFSEYRPAWSVWNLLKAERELVFAPQSDSDTAVQALWKEGALR